jgi:hypothetical protein
MKRRKGMDSTLGKMAAKITARKARYIFLPIVVVDSIEFLLAGIRLPGQSRCVADVRAHRTVV